MLPSASDSLRASYIFFENDCPRYLRKLAVLQSSQTVEGEWRAAAKAGGDLVVGGRRRCLTDVCDIKVQPTWRLLVWGSEAGPASTPLSARPGKTHNSVAPQSPTGDSVKQDEEKNLKQDQIEHTWIECTSRSWLALSLKRGAPPQVSY